MNFHHLRENIKNNYWIRLLYLVCYKNCSKKIVYKAGEFIGNKIAAAVTKSDDDNIEK